MTPPTSLLILGTGTYAMDVADLIDDIPHLEVAGFVASLPPYQPGMRLLGKPVYWVDDIETMADSHQAVCALVTTRRFKFVEQVQALGFRFASVVHPSARVSRRAELGAGVIVNGGVQVATLTRIGDHVILNRGALVGHHNTLAEYVTVSPGANLAGSVTVGARTYIGLGANVLEKIVIGEDSVVGAGALVTRNVPSRVKALGVPAKVVEEGIEGM